MQPPSPTVTKAIIAIVAKARIDQSPVWLLFMRDLTRSFAGNLWQFGHIWNLINEGLRAQLPVHFPCESNWDSDEKFCAAWFAD